MKALQSRSRVSRLLLAAMLAVATAFSGQAAYDLPALEKVEGEVKAVAEKATPCIVAITHPERRGLSSGSGCVIGADGLILTAAHVVGDAKTVNVVFVDRKLVHAKVLGADYRRDVALAKIIEPGDYPFMDLGDSKKLGIGDLVVALGHPGGFDPQRKPPIRFGRVYEFNHDRFIRTDCMLASGDSGGPLFDLSGKVIGVHCSVGVDLSVNNDVPAEAVRADWDRLMRGDHWGEKMGGFRIEGTKKPSPFTSEELAGLDLDKFRARLIESAMQSGGHLKTNPEQIAGWLREAGMKEERVKALKGDDAARFVQKALGDRASTETFRFPGEELAGLNFEKFRKLVEAEASKNHGKIDAAPEVIAGWLKACGMREEHAKAMSPEALNAFVQKVQKATTDRTGSANASGAKPPTPADEEIPGLDMDKFRTLVLREALKAGGTIAATPEKIQKWLKASGVKDDKAAAAGAKQLVGLLEKALGSAMMQEEEQPAAVLQQDKEVLEAIKPGLARIAPSMVALIDGEKTLALGTIVRENGFILTKHTEIAKAKGLKVRLADGHTYAAKEVQEFAGHDLALVKIAAEGLHAASISGQPPAIHLGTLVFSPGASSESPVVGQGIVSLLDRSLKQSGGYLGIAMNEVENAIEVTEVVPASPAAKAGMQRKDRIIAIDDTTFRTTQDLSDYIRQREPDSTVQVKFRRGADEKVAAVKLGDRAKLAVRRRPDNQATELGTEVSERHSGFPVVFQHDQPLQPNDCGGVILDLHGQIVGVNVARADRVETYAVPASVVADLLQGVDFQKLGH